MRRRVSTEPARRVEQQQKDGRWVDRRCAAAAAAAASAPRRRRPVATIAVDLVGFDVGRGRVVGPRMVVGSGRTRTVLARPVAAPHRRFRRRRGRLVEAQLVHVVQDRLTVVVLRTVADACAQFGRLFLIR